MTDDFLTFYSVMVLAGGQATRMAGNKAFADFEGTALIDHVIRQLSIPKDKVWVNVKDAKMAEHPQLRAYRTLVDAPPLDRLGPLSGILTGLNVSEKSGCRGVITTPCDMPMIPKTMVQTLANAAQEKPDHIIYFKAERDYPLCAFWPIGVRTVLHHALISAREKGGLSVMKFISQQPHYTLALANEADFRNMNTL